MNEEFVKFCIVGGTGIIVNNILLWVFVDIIKIPLYIAGNLAIFFSILYVFILNDIWTFANRTKKKHVFLRLVKFYISRAFGWIVQITILLALSAMGVQYIIANTIGIFIAFIINYITSHYWVWE